MLTFNDFAETYIKVPQLSRRDFLYEFFREKSRLHIFGKFFFSHIIKGEYETKDCHKDLLTELNKKKDSAIIFPRGCAKSTWVKIDTIHDIVYSLEPVILYVGATITDAGFHFESIKSELENNSLLKRCYGDLVPPEANSGRKWTNTHFETINNINVVARGASKGRGVNIKNQRPTKIILDDCETDEMVRSADRRIKFHYWLYNVIFPSLCPETGKIKYIGTVLSQTCEILKFYKQHGGIFKKIIENGKSIWHERYSLQALQKLKEKIGSLSFAQEYMNNPVNEELSTIKRKWLEDNYYTTLPRPFGLNKIIMFDPQSGESASADFYGLCVLGFYDKDLHRYVLESQIGKASQREQAELVISTWQKHKKETILVGVEKVMTQVAVYQYILDWKAGLVKFDNIDNIDRNIPIMAVSPKGKDKKARLQMHEAAFERGEIHLHSTMLRLTDTLVAFPDVEHDDEVDGLLFCCEYANNKKSSTSETEYDTNNNTSIVGNIRDMQF